MNPSSPVAATRDTIGTTVLEAEWRGLFDGVYDYLAGPVDEDRVGRGINELVLGLRRL